jgi:hypothetical protein
LSYLICHFSYGNCLPAATPDPAAVAAARTEITAFEPFLREPLCEQIAVKYQLSTDQAIIGNLDKTIELAEEVAGADQGFDFPIDRVFKLLAARLDATQTRAISLDVLERRTQFTQLPTTGAVVGDTFYYITNSQIDHFQNGKVLHPETLAPIVVAKVELK